MEVSMKRLIVCCDGTWSKPDNKYVTNVEKIARTVQNDPALAGGVGQLIYYIGGVGGSSYGADNILGGAFGFGLSANVIASYRFLAQNYEFGDEIFIFGFSRGAYTARSLAGMIARVGLLTEQSLVEERLRDAVHIYQRKQLPEGAFGASVEEFKADHCHSPKIAFLGVFDTVGALGVPGFRWRTPKFHDVQLSWEVEIARQALAIDEERLIFAPTFWEHPAEPSPEYLERLKGAPRDRVKQVWFEGSHSDAGGGYAETGLSDTALLWMVKEAHKAGLVFDAPLLAHYVNSGSDPIRHNSLTFGFAVHNLLLKMKIGKSRAALDRTFDHGRRRLINELALSVKVASSAINHYQADSAGEKIEQTEYRPENLELYGKATTGFTDHAEAVTALPDKVVDLTPLGVPLMPSVPSGEEATTESSPYR
jgi:uncharacterized protein (DUF2235 family)